MIYVQSKGRPESVRRNIGTWLDTGMVVVLVVEREEVEDYLKALPVMDGVIMERKRIRVLQLSKSNQGLLYSRQASLEDALDRRLASMVVLDDDIKVPPNLSVLTSYVEENAVSAAAAYRSIHQLFHGIHPWTGPHEIRGGAVYQVVAFQPCKAEAVGGYDLALPTADDADLRLRLMLGGMGPWILHSDVIYSMVGKKGDPGGMNMLGDRNEIEREAMRVMREKYGEDLIGFARRKKGTDSMVMRWKKIYKLIDEEREEEIKEILERARNHKGKPYRPKTLM